MADQRPPSYGALASSSSSTPRNPAVPEIRSAIPPDELTQLVLQRTENWTSSAAIQETDLSAPPVGADLPQEPATSSFRRTWLLSLDLLRGLLLCLQAFDTACLLLAKSDATDPTPPPAIPGAGRSAWATLGHEALRTYHWRAVTYPAAPGLFFLLGAGPVFFLNAQAKLGWSTGKQLWHFLLRALCLLLISEVIAVLLPWHRGSPVLYGLLPHWVLGFAYFVAGLVLIIAFHIERFAARSYMRALIRHRRIRRRIGEVLWKSDSQDAVPTVNSVERSQASENGGENVPAEPEPKTLVWAAFSVDAILLAMAIGGLGGNLVLAKSLRRDALQGIVRERNWLFWLFIAPSHSSATRVSPLMSAYTPITWLSPTFGGIVYGRWLSRRARSKTVIQVVNGLFAVVMIAAFCVMRAIPVLNVADGIPSLPRDPSHLEPIKAGPLTTLKYPPEPTHILLYSAIFFILLNLVSLIPAHVGERSPLLVYGTSPFAFLFFSVVYFKVLSPYFLRMFDVWPRLALIWVLPIYVAGLLLLHYGCRIYGAFKARKPVTSIWRFL